VIIALYNGDGTYPSGSTNLIQTVTNHPPVANPLTVNRNHGVGMHISVTNLLKNFCTDVDSDTLTLAGYGPVTETNMVNLTVVSNASSYFINYTNPATQLDDRFMYWVTDNQGGYATNYVTVHVVDTTLTGTPITGQLTTNNIGTNLTFAVRYYGVIGYTYVVQRSTNFSNWVNLATNTMPTNPPVIYTDTNPPQPTAYYRVAWKP
jgi:hypothetical protein